MAYNPAIHKRKSIRLKGYDYSQAGLYFITICVQNRELLFGKIENDEMEDNTDIEKEYLISDLDELKKSSEENKSLKKELMKQKQSGNRR